MSTTAGMDLCETIPLCKVAAEAEVMQVVAAFTQLYRDNTCDLHRIYKWVDKVSLEWCQTQMADLTLADAECAGLILAL